jgi:multidrug resistance efflux pump
MRWKVTLLGLVVLLGVAGAVAYSCTLRRSPEVLVLPGTVETQEVRLASRVGGRVKEVLVAESVVVQAGQPLVRLEMPELEAQKARLESQLAGAEAALTRAVRGPRPEEIEAARAAMEAAAARARRTDAGWRTEEVEQARHDLSALDADLLRADQDLDRERNLIPSRATSVQNVEQAQATRDRLQSQVRAARAHLKMLETGSRPEDKAEAAAELARLRAQYELLLAGTRYEDIQEAKARVGELQARLEELQTQLQELVVLAPEPAVVEVLPVRPGDVATPNQSLVRVLRADDLWVRAYVSEIDLGKVRLGQQVQVFLDSYPGRPFAGQLIYIASSSEYTPRNIQSIEGRRHQVFAVKVHVPDPEGVFKSGMAAEVRIPLH